MFASTVLPPVWGKTVEKDSGGITAKHSALPFRVPLWNAVVFVAASRRLKTCVEGVDSPSPVTRNRQYIEQTRVTKQTRVGVVMLRRNHPERLSSSLGRVSSGSCGPGNAPRYALYRPGACANKIYSVSQQYHHE